MTEPNTKSHQGRLRFLKPNGDLAAAARSRPIYFRRHHASGIVPAYPSRPKESDLVTRPRRLPTYADPLLRRQNEGPAARGSVSGPRTMHHRRGATTIQLWRRSALDQDDHVAYVHRYGSGGEPRARSWAPAGPSGPNAGRPRSPPGAFCHPSRSAPLPDPTTVAHPSSSSHHPRLAFRRSAARRRRYLVTAFVAGWRGHVPDRLCAQTHSTSLGSRARAPPVRSGPPSRSARLATVRCRHR